METGPLWFGRLAVTAFFAIAFLQSGIDKVVDRQGNMEFLTGHFAKSPLRSTLPMLFGVLTVLEIVTGLCCALGGLLLLLGMGPGIARLGLELSLASLFCLFFGQRLAKDYAGAAVLAAYYAVALVGLLLLGWKMA